MWATSKMFIKLYQVNDCRLGENSPNRVTLEIVVNSTIFLQTPFALGTKLLFARAAGERTYDLFFF
jgi:hypothetical protein